MHAAAAVVAAAAACLAGAAGRDLFDPTKSKSLDLVDGLRFTAAYLDGTEVQGRVGDDVVEFEGGLEVETTVGLITSVSGLLADDDTVNGILGLGPAGGATLTGGRPLVSQLRDQGQIEQNVFGVALHEPEGVLHLGGYDTDAIAPGHELVWADAVPECDEDACEFLHWNVEISGIRFGDTELLQLPAGKTHIDATVDTGSSCLILPTDNDDATNNVYTDFLATFNEYIVSRQSFNDTRSIFVTIGQTEFEMPWHDYVTDGLDPRSVRRCVDTIDAHPGILILGSVFHRSHYIVHDLADSAAPRVGFAPLDPSYNTRRAARRSPPGGFKELEVARVSVPDNSDAAQQRRRQEQGSVSLEAGNKELYFITTHIGTPPQRIERVILDTGSSSMVIFSENKFPGISADDWLTFVVMLLVISVITLLACSLIRQRRRLQMQQRRGPQQQIQFSSLATDPMYAPSFAHTGGMSAQEMVDRGLITPEYAQSLTRGGTIAQQPVPQQPALQSTMVGGRRPPPTRPAPVPAAMATSNDRFVHVPDPDNPGDTLVVPREVYEQQFK